MCIRDSSYIDSNQKLIQLLMEDNMMGQLMLQQDLQDRKQLGLFGLKKNSEILGVNQGAMMNNYSKATVANSPNNKDLWALPNKDL